MRQNWQNAFNPNTAVHCIEKTVVCWWLDLLITFCPSYNQYLILLKTVVNSNPTTTVLKSPAATPLGNFPNIKK